LNIRIEDDIIRSIYVVTIKNDSGLLCQRFVFQLLTNFIHCYYKSTWTYNREELYEISSKLFREIRITAL